MSSNAMELLNDTRLVYLVSNRLPKPEDRRRAAKLGATLIHMGLRQLAEYYDSWQLHHREHVDEPFSGSLVRSTANLSTDYDNYLDVLEGSIDLDIRAETASDEEVVDAAETLSLQITSHPEFSADSINASQLAKLILSITIEHAVAEQQLEAERNFWVNGDVNDPSFIEQVHFRLQNQRDVLSEYPGDPLLELMSDDARQTDEEIAEDYWDGQWQKTNGIALRDYLAKEFYKGKFEEAVDIVTSLQVAEQLKKEAEEFGFELSEQYQ